MIGLTRNSGTADAMKCEHGKPIDCAECLIRIGANEARAERYRAALGELMNAIKKAWSGASDPHFAQDPAELYAWAANRQRQVYEIDPSELERPEDDPSKFDAQWRKP